MLPWVKVDEVRTADGTRLTLSRRGTEWEVCFDGLVLMSSRAHGSEDELARLAEDHAGFRAPLARANSSATPCRNGAPARSSS